MTTAENTTAFDPASITSVEQTHDLHYKDAAVSLRYRMMRLGVTLRGATPLPYGTRAGS